MSLHDVTFGNNSGAELDYAQITSPVSTTGTTTAITGNAVLYDGSTRIKLEVYAPYFTATASGDAGSVNLFEGSTDMGYLAVLAHSATNELDVPCYGARFFTPSAGSHTYLIKVNRFAGGTGTITLQAGVGGTATALPAWYRITIA